MEVGVATKGWQGLELLAAQFAGKFLVSGQWLPLETVLRSLGAMCFSMKGEPLLTGELLATDIARIRRLTRVDSFMIMQAGTAIELCLADGAGEETASLVQLLVQPQSCPRLEATLAHFTGKRFLIGMTQHVGGQPGTSAEGLAAQRASEWPLTRVSPHVLSERVAGCKATIAQFTLEGFLACMDAPVLNKIRLGRESLVAEVTAVCFLPRVDFHVTNHRVLVAKLHVAKLTLVRLFSCMCFLMHFQMSLLGVALGTHVTLERFLT